MKFRVIGTSSPCQYVVKSRRTSATASFRDDVLHVFDMIRKFLRAELLWH